MTIQAADQAPRRFPPVVPARAWRREMTELSVRLSLAEEDGDERQVAYILKRLDATLSALRNRYGL